MRILKNARLPDIKGMIGREALLIAFLIIPLSLSEAGAQDMIRISGLVTTFNSIPLRNVRILAEKSREYTTTDSSGLFTIMCIPRDNLVISASGFVNKRVKTGKSSLLKINLTLKDDKTSFDDAVSNGHAPAYKLSEAMARKEDGNEKNYDKYKSIYDLISGEIYNVRVKGTSVLNTKVRSFDASPQVLYVVDGKIVSDISYISPFYVRSIEFVDDVSASLYGQQGANGVLKITLK